MGSTSEPELEFIRGALGEIGQRGMPGKAHPIWRVFAAASVAAIYAALQVRFILHHLAMWLKNRVYSVLKLILRGLDYCLGRARGIVLQLLFPSRAD